MALLLGRIIHVIAVAVSLVVFIWAFAGCGSYETDARHVPYDAIEGFWEADHKVDGRALTSDTIDALNADGALVVSNPADVRSFCPAYRKLDRNGRLAFWVALISSIADHESSFDATAQHAEKFKDETGATVVSRGLLQISNRSTRPYGCNWNSEDELNDPQLNLACGVKVLSRLVLEDGVISGGDEDRWLGGARYWAVLRTGSKLAEIRAAVSALDVCQP